MKAISKEFQKGENKKCILLELLRTNGTIIIGPLKAQDIRLRRLRTRGHIFPTPTHTKKKQEPFQEVTAYNYVRYSSKLQISRGFTLKILSQIVFPEKVV